MRAKSFSGPCEDRRASIPKREVLRAERLAQKADCFRSDPMHFKQLRSGPFGNLGEREDSGADKGLRGRSPDGLGKVADFACGH